MTKTVIAGSQKTKITQHVVTYDADGYVVSNAIGTSTAMAALTVLAPMVSVSKGARGLVTRETLVGRDDMPLARRGVAYRSRTYDGQGRMIKRSYHTSDGRLTMADDGERYAFFTIKYDG